MRPIKAIAPHLLSMTKIVRRRNDTALPWRLAEVRPLTTAHGTIAPFKHRLVIDHKAECVPEVSRVCSTTQRRPELRIRAARLGTEVFEKFGRGHKKQVAGGRPAEIQ
jgi:hypothetical protein